MIEDEKNKARQQFADLLSLARQQGHLTYHQVNTQLKDSSHVNSLLRVLDEDGVELVEGDEPDMPFDEVRWLSGAYPGQMLAHVIGTISPRRARMLGVARCRRLWELFADPRSRFAIKTAEQLADGMATEDVRLQTLAGAEAALRDRREHDNTSTSKEFMLLSTPEQAAIHILSSDHQAVAGCGLGIAYSLESFGHPLALASLVTHDQDEASLFQCIFGNPFRPVVLDPSWLSSTVTVLAQQMYDSRDFSAMPILADALQDGGCTNDEILRHCRSVGMHVRGCFVVDLLLNKC